MWQRTPFTRTCQECFHKIECTNYMDLQVQNDAAWERYINRKCPNCKSVGSFDFGSSTMKWVNIGDGPEPEES